MPNILDIFRTAPAAPAAPVQAPAQVAATPGNIPDQPASPTQTTPATDANGVVPVKDDSPLAEFNTLWDTAPKVETPAAPTGLNQADVATAVSKIDFTSAITPEHLAAISAGGEGAIAALQASLNSVAQSTLVHSTMVNDKLMAKTVADALAQQEAKLPALLRSQNAANHLKETNPLFDNPAIKPVIEATQAQLLEKFPNATQAELTTMTNNYIQAMGSAFAPAPVVNDGNGADTTDWDAYLTAP